jgi:hypothetical protein
VKNCIDVTRNISREEALKMINPLAWGVSFESPEDHKWQFLNDCNNDQIENKLLSMLKETRIRINQNVSESISNLIMFSQSRSYYLRSCAEKEARNALRRFGMIVTRSNRYVFIPNSNDGLQDLFINELDSDNWNQYLRRFRGSKVCEAPRKIDGVSQRGLLLPMKYFMI